MRNGDGPVRDEERGTRELPAEGGSGGPRRTADDGSLVPRGGIPEQARPHPEEETSEAGVMDDGQREQDGAVRIGGVSP